MSNERIFELLRDAVPATERPPYVATGQLTTADLRAAMKLVRDTVNYTSCLTSNQHVVHPLEWERGGQARCANCGTIVDLGTR